MVSSSGSSGNSGDSSRVPRATLIVVGGMSRVPRASFGWGVGVVARFRPPRSGTKVLDINRYRRLEPLVLQAKRGRYLVRATLRNDLVVDLTLMPTLNFVGKVRFEITGRKNR